MCPPAQSISGQVTGEGEEEESTDFDQLVKQEIVKCRLNSVKKQLVFHSLEKSFTISFTVIFT